MRISFTTKVALVISTLILLLGNALIIAKNYNTEWRHYQQEYLKLALAGADDPQMREMLEARSPRIEQLIINQFGENRVERCITCHAAIDDENFTDAPQPFRTHPPVPGNHPYRTFGCTTCHAGNGRGLSASDAHGEWKFWLQPLLRGDYIEAGCAKCHPAPYLDETPMLQKGVELFFTKACYACHKVEGVSDGKLGVELSEVGTKWHIEYLEESIVDPKANNFESLMPKLDMTEEELKALVIYLKSLTGENLVDGTVNQYVALKEWKALEPSEVPVTVESGEQVFTDKACIACHTINGEGGKVGPDLSVYGLQRTPEWMIQHHLNPRSLIGGSLMPAFKYSQSELDALALYLSAQIELTADNAKIYNTQQ